MNPRLLGRLEIIGAVMVPGLTVIAIFARCLRR